MGQGRGMSPFMTSTPRLDPRSFSMSPDASRPIPGSQSLLSAREAEVIDWRFPLAPEQRGHVIERRLDQASPVADGKILRNQAPLPLKVGNVVEVLHDGGTGWVRS